MRLVEKIYSDIRRVKFIYKNQLHTHYVSHEETYDPDQFDGDFAESITYFICHFFPDKPIKSGEFLGESTCPRIMVCKDSCILIVE